MKKIIILSSLFLLIEGITALMLVNCHRKVNSFAIES